MENWMLRLKRAYDVGYYKTEVAPGQQSGFPRQNKTCRASYRRSLFVTASRSARHAGTEAMDGRLVV